MNNKSKDYICPDCRLPLGSNDQECKNCYDYNDYMIDDYIDEQTARQWEDYLEYLRILQDDQNELRSKLYEK
jgi:hypothetical protein